MWSAGFSDLCFYALLISKQKSINMNTHHWVPRTGLFTRETAIAELPTDLVRQSWSLLAINDPI